MPTSSAIQQLDNIPAELKALNQWCCWKYEDIGSSKPTKVPYNPNTGVPISVTLPGTWCKFVDAVKGYAGGEYDGIGFIFSKQDPYTFVDLDDTKGDAVALARQMKIFKEFDSYSEISPSGKGLHIIVKGNIPVGRRRAFIELYSNSRYATFTGNVYHNQPIKEQQNMTMLLWEQMGNTLPQTNSFKGDAEKYNDEEIIKQATEAVNGEKFTSLYTGKWQGIYQSQSEADFALIDIISFYTQNRNQIQRIFRCSALGLRDKAKREDYLEWMIGRSFDRVLPHNDLDGFKNEIEQEIFNIKNDPNGANVPAITEVGPPTVAPTIPDKIKGVSLPPGLLGEIAQFIYSAAPRPVPEIAIAGAIGLMAGICGRAYNVSSTGLNLYILLLAKTGRGKEAIQSGISKLIAATRQQVPTIIECIGPDEIASGPALYKYLNGNPCFVSVLSEFGLRMQQLSDSAGNGPNVSLRRMILQLYAKSGFNDIAHPSIYSDKDKNIGSISSPAFSVLGESTPHTFYKNLNEDMISEGLLPRFLLIEYDGDRVDENVHHAEATPSFSLIDKLATIAGNAMSVQKSDPRRVINVTLSPEAAKISYAYSRLCDRYINDKTSNEVVIELWNRAHLKALKLSAIVAIGVNIFFPVVEAEHFNWAIDMINNDINTLSGKFEKGIIGANTQETKQLDEVIKIIREYCVGDWDKINKYCDQSAKGRKIFDDKVVSYIYISRRLISMAAFRNDKMGSTHAIKKTIQTLMDRDYIRELNKQELREKYGTTQRAFIVSNTHILKEER